MPLQGILGLRPGQQDVEQGSLCQETLVHSVSDQDEDLGTGSRSGRLTASQAAKLRMHRSWDVLPTKRLLDSLLSKYRRQGECFRGFYLHIFNYIFYLNWFSKELKIATLPWCCCRVFAQLPRSGRAWPPRVWEQRLLPGLWVT